VARSAVIAAPVAAASGLRPTIAVPPAKKSERIGIEVVPDVKSSDQMSSPWTRTSGSVA